MNLAALFAILQTLLPVVEQGTALFIHKHSTQDKLALTFGEIETVAAVAGAVAPVIRAAVDAPKA